jgi:hypothetical protein
MKTDELLMNSSEIAHQQPLFLHGSHIMLYTKERLFQRYNKIARVNPSPVLPVIAMFYSSSRSRASRALL